MKRILPALVAVLAVLTAVSGCAQLPKQMDTVRVAGAPFESLGLLYVAQDKNMFADHGVKLEYREYATGVAALDQVIEGAADVAVGTSEYPLAGKVLQGAPISAIACIDKPEFIYVVGRKDRGVSKPADLAGKRIGTVAGSVAQFYLGRFLELNNLSAKAITFVDLKTPDAWRKAIADGDVDAVVLAQPEASLVEGRLGTNATFFSVQAGQPAYTLAISQDTWIAQNPGVVTKFLAALADAEKFVEEDPAGARAIIQKRLQLDPKYMDLVETQNTFSLSLDQSLITAMEDETRWMIRNGMTPKAEVPDFSDHVYIDGLRQVKPETVNIVR